MNTSAKTLNQMNQWIDGHAEELVEELRAFSRIPSVSRADLAVPRAPFGPQVRQMLSHALMRGAVYGLNTADHEGYCGSVFIGDINNAIGIIGHLDVVPEGDKWIYPPYEATRVGDYLVGRGVSDNKSACVIGLYLLRMVKELDIKMNHALRLILGCSEETGMQDMAYFTRTQVAPVVSIVPDSAFPVNYAQKGTLSAQLSIERGKDILSFTGGEVPNMVPPHAQALIRAPYDQAAAAFKAQGLSEGFTLSAEGEFTRVCAQGVAAHAARPEAGKSAIFHLAGALIKTGLVSGQSLAAMRAVADVSGDYSGAQMGVDGEDEQTGKTTMVIGVARDSESALTLSVDARLSISADLEKIEQAARDYCARMGFTPLSVKTTRPFYMAQDDPRVRVLMDVYRAQTGRDDAPYTSGGGTYSRCVPDAITFGPGFPGENRMLEGLGEGHGSAHAPDECVYIPDLIRAAKIYAAAIMELDAVV